MRNDIRAQLISEKIFEKVTEDVKVTDARSQKYYDENKAQYSQPESRDVRHILVKTKAQADELYASSRTAPTSPRWRRSTRRTPARRRNGGKLTVSKGQTVAPFDQTAFALKKNEISKPVKTQFG